ncbi:MAG: hypothetical protein AAB600_04110 [Patescibacteria group bacterium]
MQFFKEEPAPLLPKEHGTLLRRPFQYTKRGLEEEKKNIETINTFAKFIKDTKDIKSPELFLEEISKNLPDVFGLVTKFENSLGKEEFSRLIRSVDLRLELLVNSRRSFTDIVKRIEENARSIGVGRSDALQMLDLTLKKVLALLAIKSNQISLGDEKISEKLNQLVDEMADSYTVEAKRMSAELDQREALMQDFLKSTGISADTVEKLLQSASSPDDVGFTVAFNSLYLASQNKLNLTLPAFRSVAKKIFPQIEEKILDTLSEQV